jgi:hypothetical protein
MHCTSTLLLVAFSFLIFPEPRPRAARLPPTLTGVAGASRKN